MKKIIVVALMTTVLITGCGNRTTNNTSTPTEISTEKSLSEESVPENSNVTIENATIETEEDESVIEEYDNGMEPIITELTLYNEDDPNICMNLDSKDGYTDIILFTMENGSPENVIMDTLVYNEENYVDEGRYCKVWVYSEPENSGLETPEFAVENYDEIAAEYYGIYCYNLATADEENTSSDGTYEMPEDIRTFATMENLGKGVVFECTFASNLGNNIYYCFKGDQGIYVTGDMYCEEPVYGQIIQVTGTFDGWCSEDDGLNFTNCIITNPYGM